MSNSKKSKANGILSALVLAYFAFLIGGLFICSKIEPMLGFSVFGTLLIFIAIVCISGGVKDGMKLTNLLIGVGAGFAGICMVVFPLLLLYAPSFENVDGQRLGMTIVILFVNAIGFATLTATIGSLIHNKLRCTETVNAEVTDRIHSRAHQGIGGSTKSVMVSYRFRFRFFYEGQEYTTEDSTGSNMDQLRVGQSITLHIDPEKPTFFYRSRPCMTAAKFVMGIVWLAVGILCLVVYVFK